MNRVSRRRIEAIAFASTAVAASVLMSHAAPQRKPVLAVLKIEAIGAVPPSLAASMDGFVAGEIFKTGAYEMVSRDRFDQVMKEFKLQKSGLCDSARCYAEMGGAMGADKLVSVTLSKAGKTYLVNLKLIDITLIKEEFVGSSPCECTEDQLLAQISDLVRRMVGTPTHAADASGDGSPLGSGTSIDGQDGRASVDTRIAKERSKLVTRGNLIWTKLCVKKSATWDDAKKTCDSFNFGGYTGWRLPTIQELTDLYDSSTRGVVPPFEGLCSKEIWTSNRRGNNSVWTFDFRSGNAGWTELDSVFNGMSTSFVCVRTSPDDVR